MKLLDYFLSSEWLIREEAFMAMYEVLNAREFNEELYDDIKRKNDEFVSIQRKKRMDLRKARMNADHLENNYANQDVMLDENGILTYPIQGKLVNKAGGLETMSGMQGYQSIQNDFVSAKNDPLVKGVLLSIDSPGGMTKGLSETSDVLNELKAVKPVVAHTDGDMASAAYWIGSTANKVFATKTAEVGSIGVYTVHMDHSKMLEKKGVKPTIIKAGKHKASNTPMEPLSEESKNDIQSSVDQSYASFLAHVSTNRNLSLEEISNWAEGKYFRSEKAKELGLVDEIGTEDKAYECLQNLIQGKQENSNTDTIQISNINSPTPLQNMNLQEDFDKLKAAHEALSQQASSLEALNKEMKEKLAVLESEETERLTKEKENLLTRLGEMGSLTATEKAIYGKCSNEELMAVLNEREGSAKKAETPAVEETVRPIFVGNVVSKSNETNDEKLAIQENAAKLAKLSQSI